MDGVAIDGVSDDAVEATFAFVDLARFTAMTEAHGDAEAVSIVRALIAPSACSNPEPSW